MCLSWWLSRYIDYFRGKIRPIFQLQKTLPYLCRQSLAAQRRQHEKVLPKLLPPFALQGQILRALRAKSVGWQGDAGRYHAAIVVSHTAPGKPVVAGIVAAVYTGAGEHRLFQG
jgi:hypothetical protein